MEGLCQSNSFPTLASTKISLKIEVQPESSLLTSQSVCLDDIPDPDDGEDAGELHHIRGALVLHWSVQGSCEVFWLLPVDGRLNTIWGTLSHWVWVRKLVDAP